MTPSSSVVYSHCVFKEIAGLHVWATQSHASGVSPVRGPVPVAYPVRSHMSVASPLRCPVPVACPLRGEVWCWGVKGSSAEKSEEKRECLNQLKSSFSELLNVKPLK